MGALIQKLYNDAGNLNSLGKILVIIAIWIVGMIIVGMMKRVLNKHIDKKGLPNSARMRTVMILAINVVRVFVYFFVIVFFLEIIGIDTKSLIATAGIMSVALGFGAQSLVKDAISGIFILTEGQFDVGDYVRINADTEHVGNVVDFSVRTTKLRDASGSMHIIPNGTITSVINHSREGYTYFLTYPVAYTVPLSVAKTASEEALKEFYDEKGHSEMAEVPELQGVTAFFETYYKIQVKFTCPVSEHWWISRGINDALVMKWEEKDFDFPVANLFPEGLNA